MRVLLGPPRLEPGMSWSLFLDSRSASTVIVARRGDNPCPQTRLWSFRLAILE
jgi:hypothetical protein